MFDVSNWLFSNRHSSIYNPKIRNSDEVKRLIRETNERAKGSIETKKKTTITAEEIMAENK